jgi:quinol monooxygenase YgiN
MNRSYYDVRLVQYQETDNDGPIDTNQRFIMSKSSSPLTIVAITKAAPGKAESLRAAQEKLVAETVTESGCLGYELHQSVEDVCVLVFVESWESEEHWRAHMQGEAIKRFHASSASNLIQDFSLFRMNLVANGSAA